MTRRSFFGASPKSSEKQQQQHQQQQQDKRRSFAFMKYSPKTNNTSMRRTREHARQIALQISHVTPNTSDSYVPPQPALMEADDASQHSAFDLEPVVAPVPAPVPNNKLDLFVERQKRVNGRKQKLLNTSSSVISVDTSVSSRSQSRAAKSMPTFPSNSSMQAANTANRFPSAQTYNMLDEQPQMSPYTLKHSKGSYGSARSFGSTGGGSFGSAGKSNHLVNYAQTPRAPITPSRREKQPSSAPGTPASSNSSVGSTGSGTNFMMEGLDHGFSFDAFGLDAHAVDQEVSAAMKELAGEWGDEFPVQSFDSPNGSRASTPPSEDEDGFENGFRLTGISGLPLQVRQSPAGSDRSSLTSSTENKAGDGQSNFFKEQAGFHSSSKVASPSRKFAESPQRRAPKQQQKGFSDDWATFGSSAFGDDDDSVFGEPFGDSSFSPQPNYAQSEPGLISSSQKGRLPQMPQLEKKPLHTIVSPEMHDGFDVNDFDSTFPPTPPRGPQSNNSAGGTSDIVSDVNVSDVGVSSDIAGEFGVDKFDDGDGADIPFEVMGSKKARSPKHEKSAEEKKQEMDDDSLAEWSVRSPVKDHGSSWGEDITPDEPSPKREEKIPRQIAHSASKNSGQSFEGFGKVKFDEIPKVQHVPHTPSKNGVQSFGILRKVEKKETPEQQLRAKECADQRTSFGSLKSRLKAPKAEPPKTYTQSDVGDTRSRGNHELASVLNRVRHGVSFEGDTKSDHGANTPFNGVASLASQFEKPKQNGHSHEQINQPKQNGYRRDKFGEPKQSGQSHEQINQPKSNGYLRDKFEEPKQNEVAHDRIKRPEQNGYPREQFDEPTQSDISHDRYDEPKQSGQSHEQVNQPRSNGYLRDKFEEPKQNEVTHDRINRPKQNGYPREQFDEPTQSDVSHDRYDEPNQSGHIREQFEELKQNRVHHDGYDQPNESDHSQDQYDEPNQSGHNSEQYEQHYDQAYDDGYYDEGSQQEGAFDKHTYEQDTYADEYYSDEQQAANPVPHMYRGKRETELQQPSHQQDEQIPDHEEEPVEEVKPKKMTYREKRELELKLVREEKERQEAAREAEKPKELDVAALIRKRIAANKLIAARDVEPATGTPSFGNVKNRLKKVSIESKITQFRAPQVEEKQPEFSVSEIKKVQATSSFDDQSLTPAHSKAEEESRDHASMTSSASSRAPEEASLEPVTARDAPSPMAAIHEAIARRAQTSSAVETKETTIVPSEPAPVKEEPAIVTDSVSITESTGDTKNKLNALLASRLVGGPSLTPSASEDDGAILLRRKQQQKTAAAPAPTPARAVSPTEATVQPAEEAPAAATGGKPALKDDPKYNRYIRMLKVGMPIDVVKHAMIRDGVDPSVLDGDHNKPAGFGTGVPLKEDPKYEKYFKMLKMGLPMGAVQNAMERDGVDSSVMDGDHSLPAGGTSGGGGEGGTVKEPNKPKDTHRRTRLHWDTLRKVRKNSLWAKIDQDEELEGIDIDEDEFAELFQAELTPVETNKSRNTGLGKKGAAVRVIDSKRANNGGIILARLKLTHDEMADAVDRIDHQVMSAEQMQNIIEYLPTSDERKSLEEYMLSGGTDAAEKFDGLCECEKFMVAMMTVKHAKRKVRALLFKLQFQSCLESLQNDTTVVETACDELSNSVRLRQLLGIVLNVGNRLNTAGVSGKRKAGAFTLDSLLKLSQAKAFDKKTTFLHYIVQVVQRNNELLLRFKDDLPTMMKADRIYWDQVETDLEEVENQLENVRRIALHQARLMTRHSLRKKKKSQSDDDDNNSLSDSSMTLEDEVECLRATEIGIFTLGAIKKVSGLRDKVETTKAKFAAVREYFGEEDKQEMQPHELFNIMVKFCRDFEKAKEQVLEKQKKKLRDERKTKRSNSDSNLDKTGNISKDGDALKNGSVPKNEAKQAPPRMNSAPGLLRASNHQPSMQRPPRGGVPERRQPGPPSQQNRGQPRPNGARPAPSEDPRRVPGRPQQPTQNDVHGNPRPRPPPSDVHGNPRSRPPPNGVQGNIRPRLPPNGAHGNPRPRPPPNGAYRNPRPPPNGSHSNPRPRPNGAYGQPNQPRAPPPARPHSGHPDDESTGVSNSRSEPTNMRQKAMQRRRQMTSKSSVETSSTSMSTYSSSAPPVASPKSDTYTALGRRVANNGRQLSPRSSIRQRRRQEQRQHTQKPAAPPPEELMWPEDAEENVEDLDFALD